MQFYDLEKLYKKLQKPYEKGEIFRDFIEGKNSFPFEVPLKKVQQKDVKSIMMGSFTIFIVAKNYFLGSIFF